MSKMNDKEKIEKALGLLNELIELAELKDEEYKSKAVSAGKGDRAVGESFDVFYLRMVRSILNGE